MLFYSNAPGIYRYKAIWVRKCLGKFFSIMTHFNTVSGLKFFFTKQAAKWWNKVTKISWNSRVSLKKWMNGKYFARKQFFFKSSIILRLEASLKSEELERKKKAKEYFEWNKRNKRPNKKSINSRKVTVVILIKFKMKKFVIFLILKHNKWNMIFSQ